VEHATVYTNQSGSHPICDKLRVSNCSGNSINPRVTVNM
jgi:hypothetical protein